MIMWRVYLEIQRFALGYDLMETHVEGKSIISFSLAFDLTITYTCFRKSEDRLITYKSGWHTLSSISLL